MLRFSWKSMRSGVRRMGLRSSYWQQQQQQQERSVPFAFQVVSLASLGSLTLSTYWLLTMGRDDVEQACKRCRTTAWGEERQLEGLEELANWIDWSATSCLVDLRPKLARDYAADECLVLGASSKREEIRAVSFEALANLLRDDELALRSAKKTRSREVAVLELERVEKTLPPKTAGEFAEIYATSLAVLSTLSCLTYKPATWACATSSADELLTEEEEEEEDLLPSGSMMKLGSAMTPDDLVERLVPALTRLMSKLRDLAAAVEENDDYNEPTSRRSSRLTSFVAELQQSAVRDMIFDLLALTLEICHNVSRINAASAFDDDGLRLLADLAWAQEPEAALHATLALHAILRQRYPDVADREAALVDLDAPPSLLQLGGNFSLDPDPRRAVAVSRVVDAFRIGPLALAAGWGAIRRAIQWHYAEEGLRQTIYPFKPPGLVRRTLSSALVTAFVTALLSAVYGPRGTRWEYRRGFYAGDSDTSQIALASAFTAADLTFIFVALRAAPFCLTPFLLLNILTF